MFSKLPRELVDVVASFIVIDACLYAFTLVDKACCESGNRWLYRVAHVKNLDTLSIRHTQRSTKIGSHPASFVTAITIGGDLVIKSLRETFRHQRESTINDGHVHFLRVAGTLQRMIQSTLKNIEEPDRIGSIKSIRFLSHSLSVSDCFTTQLADKFHLEELVVNIGWKDDEFDLKIWTSLSTTTLKTAQVHVNDDHWLPPTSTAETTSTMLRHMAAHSMNITSLCLQLRKPSSLIQRALNDSAVSFENLQELELADEGIKGLPFDYSRLICRHPDIQVLRYMCKHPLDPLVAGRLRMLRVFFATAENCITLAEAGIAVRDITVKFRPQMTADERQALLHALSLYHGSLEQLRLWERVDTSGGLPVPGLPLPFLVDVVQSLPKLKALDCPINSPDSEYKLAERLETVYTALCTWRRLQRLQLSFYLYLVVHSSDWRDVAQMHQDQLVAWRKSSTGDFGLRATILLHSLVGHTVLPILKGCVEFGRNSKDLLVFNCVC